MAAYHHLCHHPVTTSASCYCQCCYSPPTPCHQHHPPPPPPPPPPQDSNIYFSTPLQPHLYSVQSHIQNLHHHHRHPHTQEGYFHEERLTHPTVSSLLCRIASLESALRRRSFPVQPSHSLRDAAARTIQTHFRAFLLRRSRTLRQLKDLASIKSTLRLLKTSVYEKSHFDHGVLYDKAMDLLLKLESVQGGDPMIRDGRKSIGRELNQFLDWIDAVCVERTGLPSNVRYRGNNVKTRLNNGERKIGNVKSGGVLKGINVTKFKGLVEKMDRLAEELEGESDSGESHNSFLRRNQVTSGNRSGILLKQHGGAHPRVTKNVRFADNGKAYSVSRNSRPLLEEDCPYSVEDGNLDDAERQLEDDLCREVEVMGVSSKDAEDEDEEENHLESGGSLPSSDGEEGFRNKSNHKADQFVFAAPLPVKMEARDDWIGKRVCNS